MRKKWSAKQPSRKPEMKLLHADDVQQSFRPTLGFMSTLQLAIRSQHPPQYLEQHLYLLLPLPLLPRHKPAAELCGHSKKTTLAPRVTPAPISSNFTKRPPPIQWHSKPRVSTHKPLAYVTMDDLFRKFAGRMPPSTTKPPRTCPPYLSPIQQHPAF